MTKTDPLMKHLTEDERRALNAAYLLEPPGAEVVHQFARALAHERAEVERLRKQLDDCTASHVLTIGVLGEYGEENKKLTAEVKRLRTQVADSHRLCVDGALDCDPLRWR